MNISCLSRSGHRSAIGWILGVALMLAVHAPAWSALATDVVVSTNRSTSASNITSPSFSTASAGELLLVFVATDAKSSGMTVTSITGAGLTWVLVRRTNAQLGTSEIWRAFAPARLAGATVRANLSQSVAASITVVSFTGADASGSNGAGAIGATGGASAVSGAPAASLVTTRDNSWVFGVGNDFDNATLRTVPANQAMVNQYLATIGDTYWVQRQNGPSATSGTTITINDTFPTTDRYNLTLVEVLAAAAAGPTFSVSGSLSPASLALGATVSLSQGGTTVSTATSDANGNYSFASVANGIYTVIPAKAGVAFDPASQSVTVSGAPATVAVFNATATTFSISGSISPASLGAGASVVLSQGGAGLATTTADATGNFSFVGFANGTYAVTPTKPGVGFAPAFQSAIVNGGPATLPAFTATATGFSVSGAITPASLGMGATVTLSQGGVTLATSTANASGTYGFASVANGSYTVTPAKAGATFSPVAQAVTVSGGPLTVPSFTATAATFAVSGSITPATLGTGAAVSLSQGGVTIATVTANSGGNFGFASVASGTYAVTPTKAGVSFTPSFRNVTVSGGPVTLAAFTAAASGSLTRPDFSVIIPTGRMSIVGTGSTREFQYTHDTFNGGSGPLVIQPEYNAASGVYLGTQYLYTLSGSTFTLSQQIPIAGAFIFHAAHGHFHFPFVTFGLYAVGADGGPGAPVALSEKNGFCIADSFIYAPNLPNAGALGNLGSCSDPLSLRGLDIGAVDEYDKSDPGQSISLANVSDGTYWLRAIVDPDNFLFESDKTNNETDVLVTINGNTVTELQRMTPVLPPPPAIGLVSPTDQTQVSGTVNLVANPSTTSTVQFLLNGQVLGGPVAAPFVLAWDTTTVPDGVSWLAVQTTDPVSGRTGTSGVARVTVVNSGTRAPVVTVSSPDAGATLSSISALGATVAATAPVGNVQFFVDGLPVGARLTAPPYLLYWDTRTASDGPHAVTATATDSFGLTGTSAPVAITVDNSHPPNVIGIDATVFSDATGTMTTPAFSTTTASDLLVAFVAYDGPTNAPQTASVSGAGLPWTLLTRSNSQHGTSEIWAVKTSFVLSNVAVTSQPSVGGFHGSLVVVAFTNAAGPGVVGQASAPTGAPDIFLPGVSAGSWVFAVGNDWDRAVGRGPIAGQVLVHQRIDSAVGDTFWVQSTAAPSTANALVNIHDSSPTGDQWNFAAVEVVATRP